MRRSQMVAVLVSALGVVALTRSETSARSAPALASMGDPACLTNYVGTPTEFDMDADHLLDACEPGLGADAGNDDSDDDGVQDGVEYGAGTNPTVNTGIFANPMGDADGDGCVNQKELDADVSNPSLDRHPGNWWDFYSIDDDDIPGYNPNGNIDLGDAIDMLQHFGHQYNGGAYQDSHDQGYDRIRLLVPRPFGLLVEGNNGIDLSEALSVLTQFGFGTADSPCAPPGPVPPEGGGVFE